MVKGNIVDIEKKEIFFGELEIKNGKIEKIHRVDDHAQDGFQYILPGFIDAHVHIESSMVTPRYFAHHVKKHGTLAVITDPHEISNVCGVEGFDYMYKEAREAPIYVHFGVPSCVPATPFETSGAGFDTNTTEYIFKSYDTVALSEMMNFPGVVNRFPDVMAKMDIAAKFHKPVDGHAPALSGADLQKYVKAGITTDHEAFSYEEAKEKIKAGMKIQIREGSAARNFEALHHLIDEYPDQVMFCTDDAHPDTLMTGHIDRIVKLAVDYKHDLFNILKAATLNAVKHYKLPLGLLREGDNADFITVNNLQDFYIISGYINGEIIYNDQAKAVPPVAENTINNFAVSQCNAAQFVVKDQQLPVKVIRALDGELVTQKESAKLASHQGYLQADTARDILKMAVVNRYREEPVVKVGFVKGFQLKTGAFASSIAHDSHNIIAVGVSDKALADAVNTVIKNYGGICVSDGSHLDIEPLPVAGLMANESVENMAGRYQKLDQKVKKIGARFQAPFMTLAFMSLLVIPSLKLGDQGLFDVDKFKFVELYEK